LKLLEKHKKKVLTVLAVATALAGAISKMRETLKRPPPDPPLHALEITEIIIDRSGQMGDKRDGDISKLDIARESARRVLEEAGTTDVFALRDFGGSNCREITRLRVKPGQKNQAAIEKALSDLRPEGKSGLARAVIDATDDFAEGDRFKTLKKRIVVVAGSASRDSCSRGDPIAEIRDRMERIKESNIRLDFHFIAIGVLGAADREEVASIAKAAGGPPPVFVDHRADVPAAVHQALVIQPAIKEAQQVEVVLNAGLAQLNEVLEAIRKRKYDEADRGIARARDESKTSGTLVSNWDKSEPDEKIQALYREAEGTRQIRDDMVETAAKMLSQAKTNDIEAYNSSVAVFNRQSAAFNQHSKAINELIHSMQGTAPGPAR